MTLTRYDHVHQRSDEWYALRRGMVTASNVGRLLTVRKLGAGDFDCPDCGASENDPCRSKVKRAGEVGAPIKTPHPERVAVAARNKATVIEPASNEDSRSLTMLLAAERATEYTEPTWTTNAMWRGIEDEPRAVDVYSRHYAPVQTCGFMVREFDGFRIGYSPDGLVAEDGLIEVKSRNQKHQFQTVVADGVPFEHMPQLQCGLLVSGREWIDYVSYSGGMPMWTFRVRPDKRWFDAILAAVKQFEVNAAEAVATYKQATEGLPMTERVEYGDEIRVA